MKLIAKAKAVKADIAKREITISFTFNMDDEELAIAEELSQYVDKDAGEVELLITPRQLPMFPVAQSALAGAEYTASHEQEQKAKQ